MPSRRSALTSSAAPLVLARAEHVNRHFDIMALADRMATEAVQAGVDTYAQRVMTTGFCAGKTSLVDGEPVFDIVEDFYDRS